MEDDFNDSIETQVNQEAEPIEEDQADLRLATIQEGLDELMGD